ncbi:MAG: lipid II:glycine glycyltransferase FemX [Candidatus Zipacnadales bacterium]
MIELHRVEWEWDAWDNRVSTFPTARLFHTSSWVCAIETLGVGKATLLEVVQDGQSIGLWPGWVTYKGPFRVFGSPLPAAHTVQMGPLMPPEVDVLELGRALERYARDTGISHVELCGEALQSDDLSVLGWEWRPRPKMILDLNSTEEDMLRRISKSRRYDIRKSKHLGVRVIQLPAEMQAIQTAWAMITHAYERKGNESPITFAAVRTIVQRLYPLGMARLLVAEDSKGSYIAALVLLVDSSSIYYWLAGSTPEGYATAAPSLLLWEAIRWAQSQGIQECDLYGIGTPGIEAFKRSWGAELTVYRHWFRSFSLLVKTAYSAYVCWRPWLYKWVRRIGCMRRSTRGTREVCE